VEHQGGASVPRHEAGGRRAPPSSSCRQVSLDINHNVKVLTPQLSIKEEVFVVLPLVTQHYYEQRVSKSFKFTLLEEVACTALRFCINLANSAGGRDFSHKASISPNTPALLAAFPTVPASFPLPAALATEEDEVVTYDPRQTKPIQGW
jgi:hypothetical protein